VTHYVLRSKSTRLYLERWPLTHGPDDAGGWLSTPPTSGECIWTSEVDAWEAANARYWNLARAIFALEILDRITAIPTP